MRLRIGYVLIAFVSVVLSSVVTVAAQTSASNAASAQVPPVIQFSSGATDVSGNLLTGSVEITFSLYNNSQGGEPLWSEKQNVTLDGSGRYSVYMGITKPNGVPMSLFTSGEAHWLEVQIAGQAAQPRVFLVSVPYAMKAGDAATIGGLPPSAFVLAAPVNSIDNAPAREDSAASLPSVVPAGSSDVTTTGGAANTLPLFTTATNIQNSAITQTGSGATAKIGINTATPATALDVTGGATVRGTLVSPTTGTATATKGFNSQPQSFVASVFNSSTVTAVPQKFQWQAEPAGNDTATPAGTLNLLYALGAATPAETGVKISSTGVFTFATGQTFPGTGKGTITGITTSSPLTGSGSAGPVALGLNTSALETTLNGKYAQLSAINTFSANQVINGELGVYGQLGIYGTNEEGSMFTVSNSGDAASSAISASNGGNYATAISASASAGGFGILSTGVQSAGSAAILGYLNGGSGLSASYSLLESDDGLDAGVWADAPTGETAAVMATADNAYAGVFYNDSTIFPTITALNNAPGGATGLVVNGTTGLAVSGVAAKGIATVLRASGPWGMCGINQAGNLSCTGQLKTVVTTGTGARQVETYTVQSAENWLEDYGSGQLQNGRASIALEAAFAETVNTGVEYHVFLTPGGDCKGLYVTQKTATSFEVHELGGGTASIPFDYKIVAKRRGHETERLVDVTDRFKSEAAAVQFKPLPQGTAKAQLQRRSQLSSAKPKPQISR